ncbi:MAG: response regulator [bacterium]|nr:response regulator [bacterium]
MSSISEDKITPKIGDKKGIKIFLVEDEPRLVSLYSFALQELGEVEIATTASEAFEKLSAFRANPPNVILLDLIIPEQPSAPLNFSKRWGFHVLGKIKEDKALKDIPVLVMTNLDEYEDRQRAKQLGVVKYIVKSNVIPKDIKELIKQAL